MGSRFPCEAPRGTTGRENWNWTSRVRMQFPCAIQERKPDVLSRLPSRDQRSTAVVGSDFPGSAVLSAFLLQLLVGVFDATDCPHVGIAELPRTLTGQCLSADAVSIDVDRGAGDDLLSTARISAGVLSVVSRRQTQRHALSSGDHPAVGELRG